MDKNLIAQVERLVEWRIQELNTTDVEAVLTSLKRGRLQMGGVPVPSTAVHSFRNRRNADKRKLIQKALARRTQAALPNVEPAVTPVVAAAVPETLAGSVSANRPQVAAIQPSRSEFLTTVARQSFLELKEQNGDIYVTLRCFDKLIGKRPDNLHRTLAARGFPLVNIEMPNERGQLRETPAIDLYYIFAVVGLADIHGMNAGERNQLFTLQREMPGWMKRFNAFDRPAPVPPLPAKGEPRMVTFLNKIVTSVTDGLSKLADRFDGRFDRLEGLLAPRPPATRTNGTTHNGPPLFRANATSKISLATPLRDINLVTKEVNRYCGSIDHFTARDILSMAKQVGIYEQPLWGADKVGVSDAIILDDGEKITWWFDVDSQDVLKGLARKKILSDNNASPS